MWSCANLHPFRTGPGSRGVAATVGAGLFGGKVLSVVLMAFVAFGWMECLCPPSQRGVRGTAGTELDEG